MESMQDEQVARGRLETSLRHGLLEEVGDRGQVGEEGAPAAKLGFAGTVDDDFEVLRERREKGDDSWEEGGFGWGWRVVDFVVEDVVQKNLESVREIRQVLV